MVNRRDFFQVAAGGLVVGGCASVTQPKPGRGPSGQDIHASSYAAGFPGPCPGRVIDVHHPDCLANGKIQPQALKSMLETGVRQLVGASSALEAWRRFVGPGDRVGLKVNCVGHPVGDASKHAVYTSHELIRELVANLRAVGVEHILLFDRYRTEFAICKYPELAAELGVSWEVSSISWDESQIDMEGYSKGDLASEAKNQAARSDGSPKVSGYDPDHFVTADFVHPVHNPSDPRTRRSHLSKILTQKVDKVINLCLIKDHAAAGVTGALKNLSHGLVDNVCRSHSRPQLNQTATFIPTVLSHPLIRQKVVLNVMEGFRGFYNGGPWASPYVFEPMRLLVSTDPVAMDRIAMQIIDERRAEAGMPSLQEAGSVNTAASGEGHHFRGTSHVELAGAVGLGAYHLSHEELRNWLGHDPGAVGRPALVVEHVRLAATS